jgi:hypothetical protein
MQASDKGGVAFSGLPLNVFDFLGAAASFLRKKAISVA